MHKHIDNRKGIVAKMRSAQDIAEAHARLDAIAEANHHAKPLLESALRLVNQQHSRLSQAISHANHKLLTNCPEDISNVTSLLQSCLEQTQNLVGILNADLSVLTHNNIAHVIDLAEQQKDGIEQCVQKLGEKFTQEIESASKSIFQ